MNYLIDGYNLLHQSDLLGRARGSGWLDKARRRLFVALQKNLDNDQLTRTTIVFDRHSNKPIDSDTRLDSGIRVLYAINHPEADDLIEIFIAQHPQPKTLTLVSSDRRLQKAAKRRGAQFRDAELWYEQLLAGRLRPSETPAPDNDKPEAPLSDVEVNRWLQEFD